MFVSKVCAAKNNQTCEITNININCLNIPSSEVMKIKLLNDPYRMQIKFKNKLIIKKNKIKKVLIIGVAYKKELDDTRESPSIEFIKILKNKKIKVDYHDPYVKKLKSRKLDRIYISKKINSNIIKKYDCVIILTNHSNINYKIIKKYSKFIVDTRNVYKKETDKILKL